MQSDLASAKFELSAAAARMTDAERAFALDASPVAWKGVQASREANEKAATRVRVLETMASEESKAAAEKAEAERVARLENELTAAEKREQTEEISDEDRELFAVGVAAFARAIANVEARLQARRAGSDEANAIRRELGRPAVRPSPRLTLGAEYFMGDAVRHGLELGHFASAAEVAHACGIANAAVGHCHSAVVSSGIQQGERTMRLVKLRRTRAAYVSEQPGRAKTLAAMESELAKLVDQNARKGDQVQKEITARQDIIVYKAGNLRLAAEIEAIANEIAEIEATIAGEKNP